MKNFAITFLKFLLFLSIGLIILYLVFQHQNAAWLEDCQLKNISPEECGTLMQKIFKDFREANYFWIFMVLIAFTASNVSRAARWMMLIRPLGYQPKFQNAFLAVAINYFVNLGIPRSGEFARAAVFGRYEGVPVEKVMGTIVVERIFDVIAILLVTALAFMLEFEKLWAFFQNLISSDTPAAVGNSGISLLWIAAALLLIVGALTWFFRKTLMESKFFKKGVEILKGFGEGLASIKNLKSPAWFLFHTFFIWLMYFAMTYLCFQAFEPTANLSPLAALSVFVAGGWGIVVPAPGGMGSYHFLVQSVLQNLYGLNGADAFSFANISFSSIQLGCNVLIGLAAVILMPILNKNYTPIVPQSNDK